MAPFYFLRHGEATWNAEGRLCGSTDIPLSDVGRQQARALGGRLQSLTVEALYSSPLSRALETARIVGEAIGREPVVDVRLAELDYGVWEGSTFDEVKRIYPEVYQAWDTDPADVAPPAGETGVHLVERVRPFLAEVAERHPLGNVVVVCHKTVCRLIACHIMGMPLCDYRRRVPMQNAALNIFEFASGQWRVLKLNDTTHLDSSRPAPGPSEAEF